MPEIDEWDDSSVPVNPVAAKARQYIALQKQIEALELICKSLSYEIAREFPAGTGKFTKTFGDVDVTLARSERWSWSKAEINAILAAATPGEPLTEEIKRALIESVAIHKTTFAKLSPAAQKTLRAALTVKDGPFKIDVEDKPA